MVTKTGFDIEKFRVTEAQRDSINAVMQELLKEDSHPENDEEGDVPHPTDEQEEQDEDARYMASFAAKFHPNFDFTLVANNITDILESHQMDYPGSLVSDLVASIYDGSIFREEE